VIFEHEGRECAREHLAIPNASRHFDDAFFSFLFCDASLREYRFAATDWCGKPCVGRPEHDVRVIYSEHCGVVGEAKDESAVDQSVRVGRHVINCLEHHNSVTICQVNRCAAEGSGNTKVCIGFGHHLPESVVDDGDYRSRAELSTPVGILMAESGPLPCVRRPSNDIESEHKQLIYS
jgi:hypothetical protein